MESLDDLEDELPLVKLLFIFGFLFLLWVWSFWIDVQDNNEFYPDGLNQCPQETYTVLEHDNSNSSRIRCLSCPVCPPGEEPSPPCGITLVTRAAGECTSCSPGTYSDETDSAACKVCTDCGSRKIVNSCTAQKDVKCKDCPWRHYEDDNTHTCKHCSSCCGKNYSAKLECFKSQKCRGNCTRATNTVKKHFSSIFNKLDAKHTNDPYNTSISNGSSLRKEVEENSKLLERVINYKQEDFTHSETKRDISDKVAAQEDYKDSTNIPTNFQELLETTEINKYVQEEADILGKKQDPSPAKNNTELTKTLANEDEEQNGPQTFPDKDFNSFQTTISPPTTTQSELGHLTPQRPKTLTPAAQTPLIVPGSVLSSFVGTIAAVLLLGLIGLFIYFVYKKCVNKMSKGYKTLSSTSLKVGEGEDDDSSNELLDKEGKNELRNETATATVLEDLNLAEIPPDLENILVKKLDVPHGDESQQFGWQEEGNAAGISRYKLKYSDIEEMLDFDEKAEYMSATSTSVTSVNLQQINLSEMPPDLDYLLVKTLDMRRKGERRYGWQKVGAAFNISKDDLEYLNLEYRRDNGSPTSTLLAILGTKGKTISDLENVLRSPKVKLPKVASIIRRYIRETNEFQ